MGLSLSSSQPSPSDANQIPELTVGWTAEARLLGEQLRQYACRAADGTPFWLKPGRPLDSGGRPLPLGPHLYNGASGVCLYLAALGHVLDDRQIKAAALCSLAPVRRRLMSLASDVAKAQQLQMRIGGAVGLGAFLYAFTRMSGWLKEPSLLEEACGVATLLTEERIAADKSLDVMYGSAGAILGLLALEREVPEGVPAKGQLLLQATACGEHLLRKRVSQNGEPLAWPYNGGDPIPGFAHGASGIAYALARLAERTRREDFLAAALEGLAFEEKFYSSEQRNWRSSPEQQESLMIAWCNGAPGIALSRLHILQITACVDSVREELETALGTTESAREALSDFLCCGNMGRAEVLLSASLILGRRDLLQAAQGIAARVIARASGHWYGPEAEDRNPAFFRGVSGIGYGLLRLASSKPLPSILLLE